MLPVLLALATLVFVVMLLVAESRARVRQAFVAKACASFCFVLLGLLEFDLTPTRFDSYLPLPFVQRRFANGVAHETA